MAGALNMPFLFCTLGQPCICSSICSTMQNTCLKVCVPCAGVGLDTGEYKDERIGLVPPQTLAGKPHNSNVIIVRNEAECTQNSREGGQCRPGVPGKSSQRR